MQLTEETFILSNGRGERDIESDEIDLPTVFLTLNTGHVTKSVDTTENAL